jgi:DNA topoisomerase-1
MSSAASLSRPSKSRHRPTPDPAALPDPIASARAAGLRYVYDTKPGITRHRHAEAFRYTGPDGKPIRDKATLARIRSIVIPPAWTDVWICPLPNGHLQATGRDARGRKQSRYHPDWRSTRDQAKYEHMLAFSAALPAIRARVQHDLALPGLPREKVLATIVRLLETTYIRVGNESYARENHSFGLTTLRRRHVTIDGAKLTFNFKGKSGVAHTINLTDRRLARIVKACHDTPGYELFDYLDHDGNPHAIGSTDVNAYLNEVTGQHFTAKDFRTWAGTVLACTLLRACETCEEPSQTFLKKNVVATVKSVAQRLGNTPSVCRKCYVHPAVLDAYLNGSLPHILRQLPTKQSSSHPGDLTPDESALIHLLHVHLNQAA